MNENDNSMDQGQASLSSIRPRQWLAQNGLDGTAEVLSVMETGTLVDMDPVVILSVKIQPAMIAAAFETTGKTAVPRSASLRVGDRIKVKYNPADPTQFAVV